MERAARKRPREPDPAAPLEGIGNVGKLQQLSETARVLAPQGSPRRAGASAAQLGGTCKAVTIVAADGPCGDVGGMLLACIDLQTSAVLALLHHPGDAGQLPAARCAPLALPRWRWRNAPPRRTGPPRWPPRTR